MEKRNFEVRSDNKRKGGVISRKCERKFVPMGNFINSMVKKKTNLYWHSKKTFDSIEI